MSKVKRKCNWCSKEYSADSRNLKRGWGLCCNKSCAAKLRESKKKPKLKVSTKKRRNVDYIGFHRDTIYPYNDYDPGDSEYWDNKDF